MAGRVPDQSFREALRETRLTDPESQWEAVLPLLVEAEHYHRAEPTGPVRPGRPRRVLNPRAGLTIRREMTRDGWILRFTGREATGPLMELVMEEIDRIFVRT